MGIFLSLGGKDRQGYRDNDDVERIISGFHRRLSEQQHERQAQINDMIGKAVDTLVNAGTLTKDSPVRRLVSPVRVEGI